MTWEEFNQVFDFTIFSQLMDHLKGKSTDLFETDTKQAKKLHKIHNSRDYFYEYHTFELLPIKEVGNKYLVKYIKRGSKFDHAEENLLGYFQQFEKGWIFASLDSSHMWKKLREKIVLKDDRYQTIVVGSNMIFTNLNEIETDKRYYLYKGNELDDTSFFFKASCVRINDVYVGSLKGFRYFLVLDYAYTSSDFTTNYYVSCETFFDHLKNISNEDIMVIFDQNHDLKDKAIVMQRYGDKMMNKLLKI
jgi:hypothetical protein